MKDLIQKLVEAWGPSGYEHHVRELIRAEVADFADEITVDPLGSLICRVGQGGKKVMVAAHMDEIGMMATFQEKKTGYLRFSNVGGLLNTAGGRAALSRSMQVRASRLIALSMDDRVGCAVAIETMRRLNRQTPNELYFVFTVQEEVGLRGARPAAYRVDPDVAIAVDVTATGDEAKSEKSIIRLGGGAAIKVHDTGLVVPPAVRDWMVAGAEAGGIPYQLELLTLGTTDAAGMQTARAGVPSGAISIPCRFVHTTSETVDIRDVEACVGLLVQLLGNEISL